MIAGGVKTPGQAVAGENDSTSGLRLQTRDSEQRTFDFRILALKSAKVAFFLQNVYQRPILVGAEQLEASIIGLSNRSLDHMLPLPRPLSGSRAHSGSDSPRAVFPGPLVPFQRRPGGTSKSSSVELPSCSGATAAVKATSSLPVRLLVATTCYQDQTKNLSKPILPKHH